MIGLQRPQIPSKYSSRFHGHVHGTGFRLHMFCTIEEKKGISPSKPMCASAPRIRNESNARDGAKASSVPAQARYTVGRGDSRLAGGQLESQSNGRQHLLATWHCTLFWLDGNFARAIPQTFRLPSRTTRQHLGKVPFECSDLC